MPGPKAPLPTVPHLGQRTLLATTGPHLWADTRRPRSPAFCWVGHKGLGWESGGGGKLSSFVGVGEHPVELSWSGSGREQRRGAGGARWAGPGGGWGRGPAAWAAGRALTEVFWHCTLELLKRRAGTLCSLPWMLRTHSYPRCPDCGCGRFLAFRVMGLITSTGTRILSARSSWGQSWGQRARLRLGAESQRWRSLRRLNTGVGSALPPRDTGKGGPGHWCPPQPPCGRKRD